MLKRVKNIHIINKTSNYVITIDIINTEKMIANILLDFV